MFQFGKDLFDGVEVWGIGRQEQKPGSGGPDGAAHRLALMATEIVEDDDVARLQRWNQNLIDIGPEALAVDWTIENPWGLGRRFSYDCRVRPVPARTPSPGWRAF